MGTFDVTEAELAAVVADPALARSILYAVERDNATGDFLLTVFEDGRAASVQLSPPMARQLAALLTAAPCQSSSGS